VRQPFAFAARARSEETPLPTPPELLERALLLAENCTERPESSAAITRTQLMLVQSSFEGFWFGRTKHRRKLDDFWIGT